MSTRCEALKNSKGPGNFRNLFMYAPNGKKDGIQLIPVSEVTARDEFFNIRNVVRFTPYSIIGGVVAARQAGG